MGSSPSLLFLLIHFLLPNPLFTTSPESDRASLLLFKSSISDPSNLLSSWTLHTHHCSWAGVSCHSDSNRVFSLNITGPLPSASQLLSSNNSPGLQAKLLGNLPPSIATLSQLTTLSLPSNAFSGPIPSQLFNLHFLQLLDLSRNLLVGILPTPLTPLPYLQTLNLGFNSIHGGIPSWLSRFKRLQVLNLAGNQFNGTLPDFVTAMDELRGLYLSFNQLHGPLPSAIGTHCSNLRYLDLSANFFTKGIPTGIGNCTDLRVLLMSSNLLDGVIPTTLGDLHNLEVLDLSGNTLDGAIPPHLGNCSLLSTLVLSSNPCPSSNTRIPCEEEYNYFTGGLPDEITSLSRLRLLWAERLTLYGPLPKNWTSCSSLQVLNLAQNFFHGGIPQQLEGCHRLLFLNLSSNELTGTISSRLAVPCMSVFDVSGNRLSGSIPVFERCRHGSLGFEIDPYLSQFLPGGTDAQMVHDFSRNNFSGAIESLPGFTGNDKVYSFSAQSNSLSFVFPGNLFNKCDSLFRGGLVINLRNNMITGRILEDRSTICSGLKALDVSSNRISGSIPAAVGELSGLLHLNFSFNRLSGGIPASIGGLQLLRSLSLSENNLTGVIPSGVGGLRSLTVLELSSNSISGEIPVGFAGLRNLTILLLDNNRLTEKVPAGLMNLPDLISLNLSFNNLSGPLPVSENFSCGVIVGNPLLGPCHLFSLVQAPPGSSNGDGSSSSLGRTQARDGNIDLTISYTEIAAVVFASIILGVFITLLVIWVVYTTRRYKTRKKSSPSLKQVIMFKDIGFPLTFDHVVEATGGFSSRNCIGNGGFGATYKAEVQPGVVVAVKRLAIGRFQGAEQFHAEIKALGSVRHENLVTLIGYHASEKEMFLILNYLPGGNLEKFIKERSVKAGVVEWRVLHKIAMDVAKALAYLHDQCTPRVLHRDVKPSNILLDDHNNAYLSDFGLARLMGVTETHATTGVAGTFGYVAPEYAMTCRVSDKADVYSYGVVLLELLSDKKALDPSFSCFGNGFNIVAWASLLLRQGRACEFFAAGLWERGSHRREMVEVLHLAVFCTLESLPNRLTMRQVVWRLNQLQPPPA